MTVLHVAEAVNKKCASPVIVERAERLPAAGCLPMLPSLAQLCIGPEPSGRLKVTGLTNDMPSLTNDELSLIFDQLDLPALQRVGQVNKAFQQLLRTSPPANAALLHDVVGFLKSLNQDGQKYVRNILTAPQTSSELNISIALLLDVVGFLKSLNKEGQKYVRNILTAPQTSSELDISIRTLWSFCDTADDSKLLWKCVAALITLAPNFVWLEIPEGHELKLVYLTPLEELWQDGNSAGVKYVMEPIDDCPFFESSPIESLSRLPSSLAGLDVGLLDLGWQDRSITVDDVVNALANHFTQLQRLDLSDIILEDASINLLGEALATQEKMQSLVLSHIFPMDCSIKLLEAASANMTQLTSLDLSFTKYSDNLIQTLTNALQPLTKLQSLNLANKVPNSLRTLSEHSIELLAIKLGRMHALTSLDLSGNDLFKPQDSAALPGGAQDSTKWYIFASLASALRNMPQMQSLVLANNLLDDIDQKTFDMLKGVCTAMKCLTSLDISGTELAKPDTAAGVQVEQFLKSLPLTLTSLDLSCNSLVGNFDHVKNSLTYLTSLEWLQLDYAVGWTKQLKRGNNKTG